MDDADVRHHYREAFRELLDTLFARQRPERAARQPWTPNPPRTGQYGGGNRRFGPDPRLQPPADETASIGQAGISAPYIAALTGGLLRYPAALRRNEAALTRLQVEDSGHAA